MKIDTCYTFSSYLHGIRSALDWCHRARTKFGLDVSRHLKLLPRKRARHVNSLHPRRPLEITEKGGLYGNRLQSVLRSGCSQRNSSRLSLDQGRGEGAKRDRWLKRFLIEAAWSVSRAKGTYLCALYHRIARRRGKKKAAGAVAHAILVIAYHILKDKVPYHDLGADHFDRLNRTYIQRYLVKRLEGLGYKVSIEPIQLAA